MVMTGGTLYVTCNSQLQVLNLPGQKLMCCRTLCIHCILDVYLFQSSQLVVFLKNILVACWQCVTSHDLIGVYRTFLLVIIV
jgi:hypothetical protein